MFVAEALNFISAWIVSLSQDKLIFSMQSLMLPKVYSGFLNYLDLASYD